MKSKNDDHHAGRRAREVYRFFRPERLAPIDENRSFASEDSPTLDPSIRREPSAPSLSPISKSLTQFARAPLRGIPESLALGSSNATLNSFAQLTALRLNVDRVFISVSDRDSQFIIAQAAQTAKGNSKYDSVGNGVYTGCATLDVSSWTPCQDTIALSRSKGNEESSFLVSNDLSQDARYKDLSFVQGKPNFRFYAGIPLTTESNINLGCFFVLDTKPHAEFTESERETMTAMSTLVMDFLKVSRQASEGRRATRLSRGLSCFVEGRSSFTEIPDDLAMGKSDAQYSTPPSSKTRASHLAIPNHNQGSRRSRSRSSDTSSVSSMSDSRFDQSISSSVESHFPGLRSGNRHRMGDEHQGNGWTFQRAANLIRESLELEGDSGVVFVEGGSDAALDLETSSDASSLETGKAASILGISTGDNAFGPETGSFSQFPVSGIEDVFMHGLLNRYSQGKLWSFHRDGLLSSSDSDDSPRKSRARTRTTSTRSKHPRKWKTTENTLLNRHFPGASQVMFVPLWNAANSQWFGGCFCWNTVENIVFDPFVELSSVMGFGSSIMAECNRVESHISDRQKADFLGSVSHELRSPLHGVMAAAELLQGTTFDDFQGSLLETINACGRTLLDTMNQVLDYTKLVSLEKDLRHLKKSMAPHMDIKSMQRSAGHLDTYMTTDISILSEEVVEGVCLGHSYSQRPTTSTNPAGAAMTSTKNPEGFNIPQLHVDVTMDIEVNDWVYYMPPGALRRIIMNIFSNAVKYTDSGHVSLHLEAKEPSENWYHPQGTKEDLIILTVSDTGRGMSADFLRGRLFVPFAQENSLSVGTGLGLSIVRSLVKSLSGRINIDSRPDEGTTVKVTLPLTRRAQEDYNRLEGGMPSPPQEDSDSITNGVRLLRDNHAGRKVAILGVEPDDARSHPLWGGLSHYLTDWYGLELVSSSVDSHIDAILADEILLEERTAWSFSDPNQAVLILSSKYVDHSTVRPEWLSSANTVSIVSRPCGPHKLARFMQKCFDQTSSLSLPELMVMPDRSQNNPPIRIKKAPSDGDIIPNDHTELPDMNNDISTLYQTPPPAPTTEQSAYLPSSSVIESIQPAPEPRKPRVLVVEDNKINLNLMLAFLKKRKLDILDSAENGKLAVDAVEQAQQSYDIIFMDISMPVMDGFDAARSIRALEKQQGADSHSLIIALTGLSGSNDELEALSSGMDLFLTKPVTLKNVSKILDKWSERGLRDE
ncbi:hypothetical protein N7457_008446 [Penicillium paradoxum]|uniref:uncharacterized protein n=1 Tax=Penicillium paradoxum TaxID=176176 RepID=UPI0025482F9B|nr:uncharacterized protein N7457_008446 [Penicillium paradoxum]KAJ5773550.1 hypothetical protein N7457_008446 [Penicillium paradoxum]